MPTTPFVHDATLTSVTDAENAMTGRWRGTQTNPWFGTYVVAFRFDADGHYASRTMSGGGPALYWGTDEDTPLKQWRLDHVNADAKGIGEIDVAFAYGNGIYGLPLWQGVIESLVFDAARERMHFVMTRADGYGPIDLDLWRCE